ncbi:MAG: hypothetical protein II173_02965, partial [Firmicutes bacterium]|nr:hypothetical protein [Bacillota bacterium]
TAPGKVDALELYHKMKEVYSWDALSREDWFVDYQNLYTFLGVLSQRAIHVSTAQALMDAGEKEKALEILDLCQERIKESNFPLESICLGFTSNDYMVVRMVSDYYKLGEPEKAAELGLKMGEQLLQSAKFYLEFSEYASSDFELVGQYIYYLADELEKGGDKEIADALTDSLEKLLSLID